MKGLSCRKNKFLQARIWWEDMEKEKGTMDKRVSSRGFSETVSLSADSCASSLARMIHEEIDVLSFIPFSIVGSLGLHYGSRVCLVPQQQFQAPTIVCLPIKINPRVNCRVGKT